MAIRKQDKKRGGKLTASVIKTPTKTKSRTNKAGQKVTTQKFSDGTKSVTKQKGNKTVTRNKNAKGKVQTKSTSTVSTGKKLEDMKQRTVTRHKSGAKTVTKNTAGKSVTRSTNRKGATTKTVSKQKTTKSGGLASVTKTTGPKGGKTKTVSKAGKTVVKKTNPKGKTTKQVIKDKPNTHKPMSPGGTPMRDPKSVKPFSQGSLAKGTFKGKRKGER